MKILVIDDSPTARQLTIKCLHELGHTDIVESGDGMQGLQRLADTPGIQLVLLDRYMPGMDGFEFMARLRQSQFGQGIYVSMVTTEDDSGEKMRALAEFDADYYITKPVTSMALVRMFNKLFPFLQHDIYA